MTFVLKTLSYLHYQTLFLDLDSNVRHKEFNTEVYDKGDVFPFSVVRMPYQNSNITTRIFYAAGKSEILRTAWITSSKKKFRKLITTLLTRMHRQRCQNTTLKHLFNKLFGTNFSIKVLK